MPREKLPPDSSLSNLKAHKQQRERAPRGRGAPRLIPHKTISYFSARSEMRQVERTEFGATGSRDNMLKRQEKCLKSPPGSWLLPMQPFKKKDQNENGRVFKLSVWEQMRNCVFVQHMLFAHFM